MNLTVYPKAKRILVIGISSVALFLVIVYWIFSCTLLNPVFYHYVFESGPVQASLDDASGKISPEGAVLFTGQSLKENAYSLAEGILRFVRQNDMSLSSIQFESETTQSIRSAVLAAAPEKTSVMPEISRIHPFVITYFLPGAENIFSALFSTQKIYSAFRSAVPMLLFISLLLILLSKKTAENAKAVCISTGIAILSASTVVLLFQRRLLLSPLSRIMSDADAVIPMVHQAVAYLVLFSAVSGALLLLTAPAITLRPVKTFLNRFSKTFAVLIILLMGMFFILFNNEVFAKTVQTEKGHAEQLQVKTLGPEDGAVHSLTIKLREVDALSPVKNVRLTLIRIDDRSEPLHLSEFSDENGDARFILPEGEFLLLADPATVPAGFNRFEPVMLTLDRPDSSWYTFCFTRTDDEAFKRETPEEGYSRLPDRPVPLLK